MTSVALRLSGHSIDELCELIESKDLSLQGVAEEWGCTKRHVRTWIDACPIRAERAREARENAADWCDREAEKVLRDLKPNSTISEVARARELAQHFRWRAKVRNPQRYADKVTIDHNLVVPASKMTDNQLATIAAKGYVIEGSAELVVDLLKPDEG